MSPTRVGADAACPRHVVETTSKAGLLELRGRSVVGRAGGRPAHAARAARETAEFVAQTPRRPHAIASVTMSRSHIWPCTAVVAPRNVLTVLPAGAPRGPHCADQQRRRRLHTVLTTRTASGTRRLTDIIHTSCLAVTCLRSDGVEIAQGPRALPPRVEHACWCRCIDRPNKRIWMT